jgi:hypothetical protein
MPAADSVLLPLCVAIALIGIVLAGVAWRRGNKGRVVQAAALVVIPFGLYLTGLLTVLWNFVVDLVRWAVHLVFSPLHWIGFGIIALSLVLFVIGAVLARLRTGAKAADKKVAGKPSGGALPRSGTASGPRAAGKAVSTRKQDPDVDPEMAEIEALLKSRGIE